MCKPLNTFTYSFTVFLDNSGKCVFQLCAVTRYINMDNTIHVSFHSICVSKYAPHHGDVPKNLAPKCGYKYHAKLYTLHGTVAEGIQIFKGRLTWKTSALNFTDNV